MTAPSFTLERSAAGGADLARIMHESSATLTPTLSLGEGEGAALIPSPPEGA